MSPSANFVKTMTNVEVLEAVIKKLESVEQMKTLDAAAAYVLGVLRKDLIMVAGNLEKTDAATGNFMKWNGETYRMTVSNQTDGQPASEPTRTDDGSFYPRMKHAEAVEMGSKALDRIAKVMEERLRMHKAGIAQMED